MKAFWEEVFKFFLKNHALGLAIVMLIMVALITFILNYAKKPIKKLTKKIKCEKVRKLANKTIILLSFVFAFGFWFLLSKVCPQYFAFNLTDIIISGALPVVAYALGEGIITKTQASGIIGVLIDIAKDGEVDKDEAKELGNKMEECVAEKPVDYASELDKLLKK